MAAETRTLLLATTLLLLCATLSTEAAEVSWEELRERADAGRTATKQDAEFVAVLTDAFRRVLTQRYGRDGAAPSDQCGDDFAALFQEMDAGNFSKGEMAVDAMGKPGSYILQGNLHITGSFDECLDIEGRLTQFCTLPLVPVVVSGKGKPEPLPEAFLMEVCLTRSCNVTDINGSISEANGYISDLPLKTNFYLHYVMNKTVCEDSKSIPFNAGSITMITVCVLFLVLALVGTAVDVGVKTLRGVMKKPELVVMVFKRREAYGSDGEHSPLLSRRATEGDIFTSFEKPLEIITAFSIVKNLNIILSTKQPPTAITSLNGIRVLSMGWVILAHTHYWALITGVLKNPVYILGHTTHRFSFQPITNGFFSVDSFFFLSGVLVAYLTLREMERRKGRFPVITYYLHRYLRLTMVYAFLLFFWWNLTVHLGNGPTWRSLAGVGSNFQKNCEKYWWTNFLYINNLYPWGLDQECMPWTWYLSNDMQFYILAPLILIPLYFLFPVGLVVAGILVVVTFVANGAIAGLKHFQANVFQDPNASESNDIYIKPYTRAAPYIVGLVLGYMLFKKVRFNFHWFVNWLLYHVVLLVAAGCLFSVVYGVYSSWDRGGLSLAENVAYFTLSRFVWAVGLSLLVFACHNGHGSAINTFLSMRFWIPLSRLTYSAYLIHPILLTLIFGTLREPFTYTDYTLVIYAVAMVVLSFGAAGVVAVFVEFPLSNLEMAVFKVIGLRLRESTRNVAADGKDMSLKPHHSKPNSSTPIND